VDSKAGRFPAYEVPHLARFPLGTPYPEVVQQFVALVQTPALRGCFIAADQTGVGRAVVDMLTDAMKGQVLCQFTGITITGGHQVTAADDGFHVPKKELVATLQVLLQTRRLRVARSLPEAGVLVKELENFRVKITESAHETFGAWREGQHDDLVLAVAMAAWVGERCREYEGPAGLPSVIGG
jgi:hypothetical protein